MMMTKFIAFISLGVFSLPAIAQNVPEPDPVILFINDPLDHQRISFSLRRDEYEYGVRSAGGDARAYLREDLLKQFLNWELERFLKDQTTMTFYDGLLYHESSINAEYDKAIRGFPEDLIEEGRLEELKEDSGRQVVLNVLIEQTLKKTGLGRDDFTPRRIKQKYDFYAGLFEHLQNQYEPYPDVLVLDELVQSNPAVSSLILYPQVQLQGVAFNLFPLERYRELNA